MTTRTDPEMRPQMSNTYYAAHPQCWDGVRYVHTCYEPSGRPCIDCGNPAGTPWGPHFCPDCDVARLDRITTSLTECYARTVWTMVNG